MKFKLDESLPDELVADLRVAGHDAESVASEGLSGSADRLLVDRATAEGRAFLTLDKGIADIRAYPPEKSSGLVLFRPPAMGRGAVLAFVRAHLPLLLQLPLDGRLPVLSSAGRGSADAGAARPRRILLRPRRVGISGAPSTSARAPRPTSR